MTTRKKASRMVLSHLTVAILFGLILITSAAVAVPPSPEAVARWKAEGVYDEKVADLIAFNANQPADLYNEAYLARDEFRTMRAMTPEATDSIKVLVILVHFPDFHYNDLIYYHPGGTQASPAVVIPPMFDSLLFSERDVDVINNPTGSMTEFYMENSYGSYFMEGDIVGWLEMPENYSYYEGGSSGLGGPGRILAGHAVDAAEAAGVDFSIYANGTSVPGVIIIHAGPGAETGNYGIWSHRSSITARWYDGVSISNYTMNPEEAGTSGFISSMGVFSHEWGHILGIQDYYDIGDNPGSEGLGSWALMAGGSWNLGGQSPAHFCAWSKMQLGYLNITALSSNLIQAPIPQVESEPVAYLLGQNPGPAYNSTEYWLVENRQKVGFDEYLPGSGLLIYHFDGAVYSQNNPDRYRLAVEQADGLLEMNYDGSSGDASDPFPGSTNNREFHDYSSPSALTNLGGLTEVGVWNISNSDSAMFADLDVIYSRTWTLLAEDSVSLDDSGPGGDGDGLWEQGESLEMNLEVQNMMRLTYDPVVHCESNNLDIPIIANDHSMGTELGSPGTNQTLTPFTFDIPSDFFSQRVTFTFTITSYEFSGGGGTVFEDVFVYDIKLGRKMILLVDDDNGNGDEVQYRNAYNRLGYPFEIWDKNSLSSPTYADLAPYDYVFWMTGPDLAPFVLGGELTAADVTAMKTYLDNDGNLMLASITASNQLNTLDPTFMADYFRAVVDGSDSKRWYLGSSLDPIGGDLAYTTRNGELWYEITNTITPVLGGQAAFTLTNSTKEDDYGTCGVTYDGSYKSVLLTMPVEFIDDTRSANGFMPKDTLIDRVLSFFQQPNACEFDTDLDGIVNCLDNCVNDPNPDQADNDLDEIGNICDNCPDAANPYQTDSDDDGPGDECDECTDTDGDGYGNAEFAANTCPDDNCPDIDNPGQEDFDGDGIGDVCDPDDDNDGTNDEADNCPFLANPGQENADGDAYGDACDDDDDNDGLLDGDDNCPLVANASQDDADGDLIGDLCDECTDTDDDGYGDPGFAANTCEEDVCQDFDDALDDDEDTVPDGCDICPGFDDLLDTDDDTWPDGCDNCPEIANPGQEDANGNDIGDVCDGCCIGMVGNVNGDIDELVTIGDIAALVDHLFITKPLLECVTEADVNQSGGPDPSQVDPGSDITIGDVAMLTDYLFITTPPIYGPLLPCF